MYLVVRHVYVCVCMYVCMYVFIYIYIYICMYVCVCIRIGYFAVVFRSVPT